MRFYFQQPRIHLLVLSSIHIVICFKETLSISTPEKGEDEVGEDDEESIEGGHNIATLLVHSVCLEQDALQQYLKIIFDDKGFTNQ